AVCVPSYLLFFFPAEDGIRGGHVTGVQTCALPIYRVRSPSHQRHAGLCARKMPSEGISRKPSSRPTDLSSNVHFHGDREQGQARSEERREGKEWGCGGRGGGE